MSDPQKSFIEPMLAVFDGPPGGNPGEFFASLTEDLARFSDDHLAASARSLRSSRKYRTFPTIAECLDAARNAVVPGSSSSQSQGYGNQDHNLEWQQKLEAFRLCRNPVGYRARKEGWIVAMFDFCREYGRAPAGREIEICIEQARASVAGMEECRGTPIYASLVSLRRAMIARREKEIFGDPLKYPSDPDERAA